MLRYQLYESNTDRISMQKEINNISNYIELEKIRKDENLKVHFNYPSAINNRVISPYILMPLVENAFKHLSGGDDNNTIEIALTLDCGIINFVVINSVDSNLKIESSSGIGIKNLKRRLDLLYKDKYELSAEETGNHYKVNLKLKQNEN